MIVLARLVLPIAITAAALLAVDAQSGDAYARFDARTNTWTIGTALVEHKLRFSGGAFSLISIENKAARRLYQTDSPPADEFRLVANGQTYSGAAGKWTWKPGDARVLAQGEIELTVTLENDLLAVQKTYVVYPETGIVRQWIRYRNRTNGSITVENPHFFSTRVRGGDASKLTLHYMTGGGSFSGSQILKEVRLSESYSRTFDSSDKIERAKVSGVDFGGAIPWGSGAYMPWFSVSDQAAAEGLFIGFDYYGPWAAEIGNRNGGPGYLGLRLSGFRKELTPGEEIETPKSFSGVFAGDLDSMGNQLKNWQYRYLWDLTNDEYFARIRVAVEMRWQHGKGIVSWGGGTQDNWDYRLAAMLRAIDVMRYAGGDIAWQDAGWHNHLGDNDGPDYSEAKRYLNKHGMGLAVWWPLYSVARESRVYRAHPEWRTSTAGIGGSNLDTSRNEVIDYLAGQLDEKAAKWGDFQWRLDGTAVVPVNGNETPMLAQYHNVARLQREFRRRHPGSSIDVCSGGGNLMGFETLRVSDVSQLTDGGSMQYGNYYSSYLFPPDKIDDWTRNANFTWENARFVLTMAPAWVGDVGLYGHEPGLTMNNGLENLRRNFEIYHYLVREGVAGRWSLVYHPKVEGDDPIYYLQRMSRDGKRGVVILKRFAHGVVTVYPKGLAPQETYDIRFEFSKGSASRTGADLMASGITLVDPAPGELVYVGLPNHPGSGSDRLAPMDPGQPAKRIGANMGITGVEIAWKPSRDNNWLSYYRIYRDGVAIDKVAKGTYYFDRGGGPGNLSANYEVQAVDGDGNASRRIAAVEIAGAPEVYTARGGYLAGKDYSYQGANGWFYEEWSGNRRARMAWNGALGQMGYYEGEAGVRRAAAGGSWMRPGDAADAVRTFVVPQSGEVAVSGVLHKDVYSTYGDGVKARVLKNDEQLWPKDGWQLLAAADTAGLAMKIGTPVRKGDRLHFQVNANGDAVDDDTVWDPVITYARVESPPPRQAEVVVDDLEHAIRYTGRGWQKLGVTPWGGDLDQGYLPERIRGSLSVSGTAGDRFSLRFRGTGVELIGDTGSDRGIAAIKLDGKEAGMIDAFVPENIFNLTAAHPSEIREPARVPKAPRIRLWGVDGLEPGEHVLEVTVTGRKNKESTGMFIALDGIVVRNGSPVEEPERK